MNIKIIDWIKSAISKADSAQATADAALPLAGGTMTGVIKAKHSNGAPVLAFYDGTNKGAELYLFSSQNSTWLGGAILRCMNSDNASYKDFYAKSDGTLTWDSKNIVRSVDGYEVGINGDAATSIEGTIRYIRLTNGVQLVFSIASGASGVAVTFPAPFRYAPSVVVNHTGTANVNTMVNNVNTTGFTAVHTWGSSVSFNYVALGWWK